MKVEIYALTTQTYGTPLIAPMKKYTKLSKGAIPGHRDAGIILLLGHGSGFFKETWEPTIEELFSLDTQRGPPRIREIWSLDCQNHGGMAIWDYADAFAALLKSGLLGIVDPEMNPIIICGHSAGSVAVTLSTSFFNPPSMLPISQIILVDPPIWSKAKDGQTTNLYQLMEAAVPIRKDIWKDFETAAQWFRKRLRWDERKHGLRSLPTAHYPDKTSGVTLKTYRLAEYIPFTRAWVPFIYDALNRLNQICQHLPVHLIYGARNDLFERDVQDSLINPQEGRVFASITRIEDAGHLVVQEAPTKLAEAIFDILSHVSWPRMSEL
ncbi:alpha/beta-hydrolase [Phlegmacium glaucopus]|nr:alpha/beta-hydrolase [Phlegmacium glaucopus]